jgi:hypothetical protein
MRGNEAIYAIRPKRATELREGEQFALISTVA